jgi:hypothetical protein
LVAFFAGLAAGFFAAAGFLAFGFAAFFSAAVRRTEYIVEIVLESKNGRYISKEEGCSQA